MLHEIRTDGVRGIGTDAVHTGLDKWKCALTVGDKVYFAPLDASCVLELDTSSGSVRGIGTDALHTGPFKWSGAAVVGDKVYFAPRCAPCVLELEVPEEPAVKRRRVQALSHLQELWECRRFPDAEVVCGGRVFPVHRAVLSAASPVFEAAFTAPMREAAERRFEVCDASGEDTNALLRACYLGPSGEPTPGLLELAVRYSMQELAKATGLGLAQNLTPENVRAHAGVLKVHRENPAVQGAWEQLLDAVQKSRVLVASLL